MASTSPSGARTSTAVRGGFGRFVTPSMRPSLVHGAKRACSQRRQPACAKHMPHQPATTGPRNSIAAPAVMLKHIRDQQHRGRDLAPPGRVGRRLGRVTDGRVGHEGQQLRIDPGPSQPTARAVPLLCVFQRLNHHVAGRYRRDLLDGGAAGGVERGERGPRGRPVEQQCQHLQRSAAQVERSVALRVSGVDVGTPRPQQVLDGDDVAERDGAVERRAAQPIARLHQGGVVPEEGAQRGRTAVERRQRVRALAVGARRERRGAVQQQQVDERAVAVHRCVHQRGDALGVGRVHRHALTQQQPRNLCVPR
eukprot:scaffold2850_cov119-Isochrysis_galbana.AAC.4